MKFLCDAMLGHIGRRLRMAGYDTLIDNGKISDLQLIEIAFREGRLLLTCDKKIQEIRGGKDVVIYLTGNDEDVWAKRLSRDYGVNWAYAPFTRCLDCNRLFEEIPPNEYDRLPLNIRQQGQAGHYCPKCNKIFWEGSHVERMKKILQQFNSLY